MNSFSFGPIGLPYELLAERLRAEASRGDPQARLMLTALERSRARRRPASRPRAATRPRERDPFLRKLLERR